MNTNVISEADKVEVSLTLTNWVDQVLTERGFIASDEVRSLTIDNALVDTGSTRLCRLRHYSADGGSSELKPWLIRQLWGCKV